MPLEIKTPLHGTIALSDRAIDAMVEVIDESGRSGIEHGVTFCQRDGSIEPDSTCKGGKCAIVVPHCPAGTERVGDLHTHTNTLNQKGYAIPSPGDRLYSLLSDDKLNCVWGQQDGKVVCESPAKVATREEKDELSARLYDLRATMGKIAAGERLRPYEMEDANELAQDLGERFATVVKTDRAGLVAAKGEPESASVERLSAADDRSQQRLERWMARAQGMGAEV